MIYITWFTCTTRIMFAGDRLFYGQSSKLPVTALKCMCVLLNRASFQTLDMKTWTGFALACVWITNITMVLLCQVITGEWLLQKYLLTKQRWTCTVSSHGQPAAMSPCWPVHCRWTEASTGCAVWVNPLGQKLPQEMQKCHGKPSTHQNPLWHLAGKPYLLNTRGSKSSWPSVP